MTTTTKTEQISEQNGHKLAKRCARKQASINCKSVYVSHWYAKRVQATADTKGQVLLWDDVAESFTDCHSLTKNQLDYVRRSVRWGSIVD
jgi:hypothetical protein